MAQSWCLSHPFEQVCSSNWDSFLQVDRGENYKSLWNHGGIMVETPNQWTPSNFNLDTSNRKGRKHVTFPSHRTFPKLVVWLCWEVLRLTPKHIVDSIYFALVSNQTVLGMSTSMWIYGSRSLSLKMIDWKTANWKISAPIHVPPIHVQLAECCCRDAAIVALKETTSMAFHRMHVVSMQPPGIVQEFTTSLVQVFQHLCWSLLKINDHLLNYQWLLNFPLKFHVKFLPPGDQSWGRGRMQFHKLTGKICLKATSTRFKKIPAPGLKPPFHRRQLLGFLDGRLADSFLLRAVGYAHGWICNSYCAFPSPTEHPSRKNTRNSHAIPYETFQSAARNIPQPFFQQGPQQEQPLAPRGAAQGAMALHCWGLNVADNGGILSRCDLRPSNTRETRKIFRCMTSTLLGGKRIDVMDSTVLLEYMQVSTLCTTPMEIPCGWGGLALVL